ncbi:MATE family efflux transporter [Domibacillus sp. A3M-37]|uniref:MATE family efflux transporter n=1 Tax=Domibacillus sp. A3M-37 TaxID=2962037 RepID=UPI002810E3D5|nr:MATE family efflux transporter [Domibacillus sp. A3M-37]
MAHPRHWLPLISFYHGARDEQRKKETIRLALFISAGVGVLFFVIGQFAAGPIVSIFGDFPPSVTSLAVDAIGLFFIAYLFTGINFVMVTYYQSIGRVRMAVWITSAREISVMLLLLAVLPRVFGLTGVWLTIPVSELIVLLTIIQYERNIRFKRADRRREQLDF